MTRPSVTWSKVAHAHVISGLGEANWQLIQTYPALVACLAMSERFEGIETWQSESLVMTEWHAILWGRQTEMLCGFGSCIIFIWVTDTTLSLLGVINIKFPLQLRQYEELGGVSCSLGWRGTHYIFWWGCAARSWKPLPYFRPKYTIFHTLFQTWISKCIPLFRPCDVCKSATLNRFTAYGTSWRPKRCSCFFSSRSTSTEAHVTQKMVSQTK